MVQQVSTNTFGVARWIVDPTLSNGTHTTIAGALTSASSGETIFVRPGTYTENLTLKAGVDIVSFEGEGDEPNVTIIGKATFTAAGSVTISGIRLTTNSDYFLSVTGSAASIVNLSSCYLSYLNNTGIQFTSSSGSSAINVFRCRGNIATTGIALCTHSAAGELKFDYSEIRNTGLSTTNNTASAGFLSFFYAEIYCPITTSGTCALNSSYSIHNTGVLNVTSITSGGSGDNRIINFQITSVTATAVSTSTTLVMVVGNIHSSNTDAIAGAGRLDYSGITFSNSSSKISTTTINRFVIDGGYYKGIQTNTAPIATCIGEQLTTQQTSPVSLTSATITNITSVTLTPGVWDISSHVFYFTTGTVAGTTGWETAVSTANNNLTAIDGGNYGMAYNSMCTVIPVNGASSLGLNTGPTRILVASNTTYYLNALGAATVTFTNVSAEGTIRAVRVG